MIEGRRPGAGEAELGDRRASSVASGEVARTGTIDGAACINVSMA